MVNMPLKTFKPRFLYFPFLQTLTMKCRRAAIRSFQELGG
jgi:hypothetical protein